MVEMETNPVSQGYHDCVVIAMPNNPPSLTIWVSSVSVCLQLIVSTFIVLSILPAISNDSGDFPGASNADCRVGWRRQVSMTVGCSMTTSTT